ncbi:MAG: class I SAM-dependent methyltransferase [Spirochaetia bacterium]|nr:class I SAM-dependent methyltransferase [Spirochaetia bacterium]
MKCKVCQSSNNYLWSVIDKFEKDIFIRKCANCLSLFQYPQLNAKEFYNQGYYEGRADYTYYDERKVLQGAKKVWVSRLKTIQRYKKSGRFLDVGCSFGGFVYVASQNFESYGLDISNFAVNEGLKWVQKLKLAPKYKGLYQGSLINLPDRKIFKNESFDVITMIETAEHLDEPVSHFQSAYRLLKPGGFLIIQTANFDAWQAIKEKDKYHYFLPGHLVYFTASGLKNMLQQIGFNKFKEFIPVDFSLLAKLQKAKSGFNSIKDYKNWMKIILYHIHSFRKKKGKYINSSYVLYAYKPL